MTEGDANGGARVSRMIPRRRRERGEAETICPRQVVRTLSADEADWRVLLPDIRRVC